jgi:hypothetical protein
MAGDATAVAWILSPGPPDASDLAPSGLAVAATTMATMITARRTMAHPSDR